jgi:L-asparaginase II
MCLRCSYCSTQLPAKNSTNRDHVTSLTHTSNKVIYDVRKVTMTVTLRSLAQQYASLQITVEVDASRHLNCKNLMTTAIPLYKIDDEASDLKGIIISEGPLLARTLADCIPRIVLDELALIKEKCEDYPLAVIFDGTSDPHG